MSKWRSFVILLLYAAVIGIAAGDDETVDFFLVYKMDQEVDGSGFFSSYKDVTAGNLSMGSKAHGSGSYRADAMLESRAECDEDTGESYESTDSDITYNESADYAYGPRAFYFGNSFSSGAFDSLGKEQICLKNYGSGISINSLFDSLDALSKDISLSLNWESSTSDDRYTPYSAFSYSDERTAKTRFNVDASFTGRGHIGVLELEGSQHDVKTLVDEDYIGTYTLSKSISHDYSYLNKFEGDTWLPCCFGGWDHMLYYDQKGFGKSANGVFDCTCYRAPESIYS